MSNVDHYSVVKVVERCARRARLSMAGSPIGDKDKESVIFFLTSWGCLLDDLLPHANALRSYLGFLGGQEIDLIVLSSSLDAFKGLILYQSELECHESWSVTLRGFKRRASPELYYGVLTPIRPLLDCLFSDFTPENFSPVFQWLTFLEKANLRDLDLKVQLEAEYAQAEVDMAQWTYEDGLIEEIASVLTEWTQNFDECVEESFFPAFGPGAIAEKTPSRNIGIAAKYSWLRSDMRLQYMLNRLPSKLDFESRGALDRTNKIVFVPKSLRKNRVISKEPAGLGYFQHAIFACMDNMIRKSEYLSDRIDLHNQLHQQDAAWAGSLFGELATVDLSAASDSVTYMLVKRVFKHPTLRRMLICTRSDYAELPSGKTVRLNKFAPMGSAVCFPVETLVFAACCEVATRRCPSVGDSDNNYCVYGDDIVIDCRALSQLQLILASLHMKVNEDKSFWGRQGLCFRESCGEYFARGTSVTPLRVSRGLFIPREWNVRGQCRTPGPRLALISLANECWMRNYSSTRSCALEFLKRGYPKLSGIAFCDPDYEGNDRLITGYDSLSNYNLRCRPSAPKGCPPHIGEVAYHTWFAYQKPDTAELRRLGIESFEKFSWYHWWRKRERLWEVCARDGTPLFRNEFGVDIAPERNFVWPYQSRERLEWVELD